MRWFQVQGPGGEVRLGALASGRLRFQWLPRSLGADPERAARLGLTDCVSASLRLRR